eukprot:TRINITY_DN9077_c0_g1_i8.p2 TRINITY_DN9077_c0_g1~~TRINITY_DN9077_c0_g1_i8.p2  ORF type:complete len:132 (+),score=11.46 TRINITY_DN9077_c0_g1_i8:180-575(+)
MDNQGVPICDIHDAWRSFPSGHSSETMSGLAYLSLFFLMQNKLFGRLAAATLVLVPLFCGGVVAFTRVMDYYHHWQDVLGGYILGSLVAFVIYFYYFPCDTIGKDKKEEAVGLQSKKKKKKKKKKKLKKTK